MSKTDNAAEEIVKKAENFTYQKLLVTEENLKKEVKKFLSYANEASQKIKETSIKIEGYDSKINSLDRELNEEERQAKFQIEKEKNFEYPSRPNEGLFASGNIISLFLSIPIAIATAKNMGSAFAFLLFIPPPFLIIRFIVGYVMQNSNDLELENWRKENQLIKDKINNYYTPSNEFLKKQKLLNDYKHFHARDKKLRSELYSTIDNYRLRIRVFKKAIEKIQLMKKRANERERTAKINAFEKKNRSGAKSIKDKLLQLAKSKKNWSCCYCEEASNISDSVADHIHPVNKGGLTTLQNMVLICRDCNSKKTNLTLRRFCKKYEFDYDEVCERLEKLGKDV